MKKINKEEMFGNLRSFLKSKGIDLQEGTYANRIRQGCNILTDSVNLSQQAFTRAKTVMDKKLEQLRHVIHEQTAPKSPFAPPPAAPPPQKAPRKPAARKAKKAPGKKAKSTSVRRQAGKK